jgi:hypothetical protein
MAQEANEEANAAFLLSLIGGVLILIGGLVVLGLGISGAFGVGYMGSMMGSMMGYMMGGFGTAAVLGVAIIAASVIGIASAVIISYGAFLVRDKPTTRSTWGGSNFGVLFDKLAELGRILGRGCSWHTQWNTCYGKQMSAQ